MIWYSRESGTASALHAPGVLIDSPNWTSCRTSISPMSSYIARTAFALSFLIPPAVGQWTGQAVAADDAKGIAFFESKICPVLVEHCYKPFGQKLASRRRTPARLAGKTRAGGDRARPSYQRPKREPVVDSHFLCRLRHQDAAQRIVCRIPSSMT